MTHGKKRPGEFEGGCPEGKKRLGDFKGGCPEGKKKLAEGSLVGCRVTVFWPLDKCWYNGKIEKFNAEQMLHSIHYDDDQMENLKLEEETWKLEVAVKQEGKHKSRTLEESTGGPATSPGERQDTTERQRQNGASSSGSSRGNKVSDLPLMFAANAPWRLRFARGSLLGPIPDHIDLRNLGQYTVTITMREQNGKLPEVTKSACFRVQKGGEIRIINAGGSNAWYPYSSLPHHVHRKKVEFQADQTLLILAVMKGPVPKVIKPLCKEGTTSKANTLADSNADSKADVRTKSTADSKREMRTGVAADSSPAQGSAARRGASEAAADSKREQGVEAAHPETGSPQNDADGTSMLGEPHSNSTAQPRLKSRPTRGVQETAGRQSRRRRSGRGAQDTCLATQCSEAHAEDAAPLQEAKESDVAGSQQDTAHTSDAGVTGSIPAVEGAAAGGFSAATGPGFERIPVVDSETQALSTLQTFIEAPRTVLLQEPGLQLQCLKRPAGQPDLYLLLLALSDGQFYEGSEVKTNGRQVRASYLDKDCQSLSYTWDVSSALAKVGKATPSSVAGNSARAYLFENGRLIIELCSQQS